MSIFARQTILILLFTLATVFLRSAKTQMLHRSSYLNNLLMDQYNERVGNSENSEPVINLDPSTLEEARRTISHLSPEARRFLFSPTIQNTITNLNQNTNTNKVVQGSGGGGGGKEEKKPDRDTEKLLGYMSPDSGTVEYDLKGKVHKICFILD